MGYRSDVHGLIYDKDEGKMSGFVMAASLKGIWPRIERLVRVTRIKAGGIVYHAIVLKQDSIKWYDEYDEVQAWGDLLRVASLMNVEYEFTKIGENPDDIYYNDSYNNSGLMYVSRQIVADYEEIETEEVTNG